MSTMNPSAMTTDRTDAARPRLAATAARASARTSAGAPESSSTGLVSWIVRYLPAEVIGTVTMVFAGLLATTSTGTPALIALVALAGELIGFYLVLAAAIFIEQARISRPLRGAAMRTPRVVAAELGVSELLDIVVVRPVALTLGVWLLPDALWGILVGKVVADLVLYASAAGAFTVAATAVTKMAARVTAHAANTEKRVAKRTTQTPPPRWARHAGRAGVA